MQANNNGPKSTSRITHEAKERVLSAISEMFADEGFSHGDMSQVLAVYLTDQAWTTPGPVTGKVLYLSKLTYALSRDIADYAAMKMDCSIATPGFDAKREVSALSEALGHMGG